MEVSIETASTKVLQTTARVAHFHVSIQQRAGEVFTEQNPMEDSLMKIFS